MKISNWVVWNNSLFYGENEESIRKELIDKQKMQENDEFLPESQWTPRIWNTKML